MLESLIAYLKIKPIGIGNKFWYFWCLIAGSIMYIFFRKKFGVMGKYLRSDIALERYGLILYARKGSDDIAYYGHSMLSFKASTNLWLKPNAGDVVLDCGAGVGIFSLSSAKKGARVISVEANSETFRVLERNVRENNLSIELHNVALSNSSGYKAIYVPKSRYGLSSTVEDWATNELESKIIKIPASTLDAITTNLPKIDWLLIDVEGGEMELLEGGTNSIRKTVNIIIEISDRTRDRVKSLLENSGFNLINTGSKHGVTEYGLYRNEAFNKT